MSWFKLFLACALFAPTALFAEPEAARDKDADPKKPTEQKPAKPDPKASSDQDRQDAMLNSLPAGQVFHGVHIPNLSPSGKLLMMFDAQSAQRIGDRDIEMQGLKIEIHNDDGSTFHVEMSHSVFNLDTRILTSDTPTTIKRDDFVINGDRAQFHVKERFGKVIGNVKMTINSGGDTPGTTGGPKPERPQKSGNKTK